MVRFDIARACGDMGLNTELLNTLPPSFYTTISRISVLTHIHAVRAFRDLRVRIRPMRHRCSNGARTVRLASGHCHHAARCYINSIILSNPLCSAAGLSPGRAHTMS